MRFAVLLLVLCACGSSEPAPRTEVAAASAQPQPLPTVAATATAPAASADATLDSGLVAAPPEDDTPGAGGGGTGEGIGLGNIGVLGHGAGSGSGYGTGHGRLGHGGAPVSIRQGATAVNGRLAPEIIQRIVRQSYGRVKLCYSKGLAKKADLTGRVNVKFVIDTSGEVSSAESTPQSTMSDGAVVSCVVTVFKSLHFPQPQGGNVTVVYPLIFSPAD